MENTPLSLSLAATERDLSEAVKAARIWSRGLKEIAAHAGVAPKKGANAIVEMARWITALAALQDLGRREPR